jgi:colanic acid biosynthesis protein WcaH
VSWLERAAFIEVVRNAPLVSIDLVLQDDDACVLLGRRRNAPAQGTWFVPGGRVHKDETLRVETRRISMAETGYALDAGAGRFLGVYEHLCAENPFGLPGFGTHYVVLAYAYRVRRHTVPGNLDQYSELHWWAAADVRAATDVHPYTKAYLRDWPPAGAATDG